MKDKKWKKVLLQMIGVIMAQCFVYMYNPIAVGYFAAAFICGPVRWSLLPIMIAAMCFVTNYVLVIKYSVTLLAVAVCMEIMIRSGNRKKANEKLAGIITGGCVFVMEFTDMLMEMVSFERIVLVTSLAVFTASFTIVMHKAVSAIGKRGLSGEEMISMAIMTGISAYYINGLFHIPPFVRDMGIYCLILYFGIKFGVGIGNGAAARRSNNAYHEIKLSAVADSFRNLAKSFRDTTKRPENGVDYEYVFNDVSGRLCSNCSNCDVCWKRDISKTRLETMTIVEAAISGGAICVEDIPKTFAQRCLNAQGFVSEINHFFDKRRLNNLWYNKMLESREAVAIQLSEMSEIIGEFSKDTYTILHVSVKKEIQIGRQLKTMGLSLRELTVLEGKNGKKEVTISVKAMRGRYILLREIETILNKALEYNLKNTNSSLAINKGQYKTLTFTEGYNFNVLNGVARRTKNKENISGDNFTFLELECGQMLISLSDGMGSGQMAHEDSEEVIELLEQMLESGFKEETAIKLINSVMLLNAGDGKPTTIDMGIIDLYSGMCNFLKLGAASTFIKRGNWVEVIKSTTLPMGVLDKVDIECVSKKLYDGDFIIVVSDGIVDGISRAEKEKVLVDIIMKADSNNPNEISEYIVSEVEKLSGTGVKDDMTVLTAGIWKR